MEEQDILAIWGQETGIKVKVFVNCSRGRSGLAIREDCLLFNLRLIKRTSVVLPTPHPHHPLPHLWLSSINSEASTDNHTMRLSYFLSRFGEWGKAAGSLRNSSKVYLVFLLTNSTLDLIISTAAVTASSLSWPAKCLWFHWIFLGLACEPNCSPFSGLYF